MDINKVGIVGFGTMGSGIATVAAINGFSVTVFEANAEMLKKGHASVSKSIERLLKKNEITGDVASFTKNISSAASLAELKNCDIVIEAVVENKQIKADIFRQLDGVVSPACILATNTSSFSIAELGKATKRPDKVIGMHFMNPVPVMKLVEVVHSDKTSQETLAAVKTLAEKLNKTPVIVKDSPAFVINRLLIPMINEACFVLMEGVTDAASIDNVMKLGAGHALGPLALSDLIGNDVVLAIMQVLHEEMKTPKYQPCPILVKMVAEGKLGRKTGNGFYDYAKQP